VRIATFSGEEIARGNKPDPFAAPAWRSPVYHTPGWIIAVAQIIRTVWAITRFLARHPLADLGAVVLFEAWRLAGWPGPVFLVAVVASALVTWRLRWPASFTRWVWLPGVSKWRRWHYHRHWAAVMTVGRLAPPHRGRALFPLLGKVTSTGCTDLVHVRLVPGQSPADFAARADNLAHGFGAHLCRVRTARPGWLVLEFVRRDALAAIIPAFSSPVAPDLRALPVGRREDGTLWSIRLHSTHLLVAGSTGAGKGSVIWGLIRALQSPMQAGLVEVLAADPKLMELAYGRAVFDTYGRYESDPHAIAAMLESAVTQMQVRAAQLAGRQRDHVPTARSPFVVVLVDEVAFLTAYHPDKTLREPARRSSATRPPPVRTRPSSTWPSPKSTTSSPERAYAARLPATWATARTAPLAGPGDPGRQGTGKMPPTSQSGRSPAGPPARSTPRRTARSTSRPSSSR
jgi:DNA segregation ATPase FtsK/SpoIIIE, S-DNA-T family